MQYLRQKAQGVLLVFATDIVYSCCYWFYCHQQHDEGT